MKYILIAAFVFPGYSSEGSRFPIWLGEFNTMQACQDAAKMISPQLKPASWLWCAPKGEEKKKARYIHEKPKNSSPISGLLIK